MRSALKQLLSASYLDELIKQSGSGSVERKLFIKMSSPLSDKSLIFDELSNPVLVVWLFSLRLKIYVKIHTRNQFCTRTLRENPNSSTLTVHIILSGSRIRCELYSTCSRYSVSLIILLISVIKSGKVSLFNSKLYLKGEGISSNLEPATSRSKQTVEKVGGMSSKTVMKVSLDRQNECLKKQVE